MVLATTAPFCSNCTATSGSPGSPGSCTPFWFLSTQARSPKLANCKLAKLAVNGVGPIALTASTWPSTALSPAISS